MSCTVRQSRQAMPSMRQQGHSSCCRRPVCSAEPQRQLQERQQEVVEWQQLLVRHRILPQWRE